MKKILRHHCEVNGMCILIVCSCMKNVPIKMIYSHQGPKAPRHECCVTLSNSAYFHHILQKEKRSSGTSFLSQVNDRSKNKNLASVYHFIYSVEMFCRTGLHQLHRWNFINSIHDLPSIMNGILVWRFPFNADRPKLNGVSPKSANLYLAHLRHNRL